MFQDYFAKILKNNFENMARSHRAGGVGGAEAPANDRRTDRRGRRRDGFSTMMTMIAWVGVDHQFQDYFSRFWQNNLEK